LSSNIIDFVRAGGDKNRKDINALLAKLQDLQAAEPEDAALQERIVLSDSFRKRSTTVTSGAPNQTIANNRVKEGTQFIRIQPPSAVQSYPHTHTLNGTPIYSGLGINNKYGAGALFNGTTDYVTVNHIAASDLDLERTDAFSMALMFKTTVTGVNEVLVWKGASIGGGNGYGIFVQSTGDKLQFRLLNSSAFPNIASTSNVSDGLWHTAVCTYPGLSNMLNAKIYIDGSLETTGTSVSVDSSIKNTDPLGIAATGTGGSALPATIAWVAIFKEELDATWATNYNAGLIDLSGGNLVTLIPFVGGEKEQPEATSNYCKSS